MILFGICLVLLITCQLLNNMLNPVPDAILKQVKQLAEQQKKLNRQILMFSIWFVWACAFLILSVGKNYKNLNGTNVKYLYFTMSSIFLVSLFLKLIYWKSGSIYGIDEPKVEVLNKVFKQHIRNQQNLIKSHLVTYTILLGISSIFYLLYIPNTSSIF